MEDGIIIDPNPTEQEEVKPEVTETEPDYKTKFSESSKEALRLLEETKAKDAEIERLRLLTEEKGANYSNESDNLYPGFENLGPEEQENLINYTNSIKKRTLEDIYKDPAIAFAKQSYNETKWNQAFQEVALKYPTLNDNKEDFKSKYYRSDNVPENIDSLMTDLAKIYLFEKAEDIGAKKVLEQENRIDIERSNGGVKTPPSNRTLEDWTMMAKNNPAEFAKNSKQFNEDLASGKLK